MPKTIEGHNNDPCRVPQRAPVLIFKNARSKSDSFAIIDSHNMNMKASLSELKHNQLYYTLQKFKAI